MEKNGQTFWLNVSPYPGSVLKSGFETILKTFRFSTTQTNPTASWKELILPNWEFASFRYPPEWTPNIKNGNNIELNKNSEKIAVFYKADDRLTKNIYAKPSDYADLMNQYINSYGNSYGGDILDRNDNAKIGKHQGTRFVIFVGGNMEIHNVFYIGALLVDVYTQAVGENVYDRILDTFDCKGF